MMMSSRSSILLLLFGVAVSSAFQVVTPSRAAPAVGPTTAAAPSSSSSSLFAVKIGKGYDPKWKKKETIGGEGLDAASKGLIGNVPVTFRQGNATRTTMALAGQPLSDVAAQAGQFIRYACKKGECGTCECMADGKWVRPCVDKVPATHLAGQPLLVTVKEIKAKATSSGKFYSFKSFLMGFYNNLLGMVGFVKMRREAKKNFADRLEYEELIRNLTLEKRSERLRKEREHVEAVRKPYQPPLFPTTIIDFKLPPTTPTAPATTRTSSSATATATTKTKTNLLRP